jgi:hypothetical protein
MCHRPGLSNGWTTRKVVSRGTVDCQLSEG